MLSERNTTERREQYVDRGAGTLLDGYSEDELEGAITHCWTAWQGVRERVSCLFKIMSDISSTVDSDSGNVDYFQGMSLGVPAFTLLPAMWHSWLEFVYADRVLIISPRI
jgi:hypothetical protein